MKNPFSFSLLSESKVLEKKIDDFLDLLSESNILFRAGLTYYLENGGSESEAFKQKMKQVYAMEHRADVLRRSIELALYEQSVIPESRADLLSLLEDLDCMINVFQENLTAFSIENPEFPQEFHLELKQLAEQCALTIEALVMAARSFLRDITMVREHTHKVMLFESEADDIALNLKKKIFKSDLTLEIKSHLRYFVEKVEQLSDEAEDAADWLAIYTIKRAN